MEKPSDNQGERQTSEDVSLGSLLRKTREDRHIEFDEAAQTTRIRRHYLEAIENEEWHKLPSPVFVKGFLKCYAEFLGLDKETILKHYSTVPSFQKSTPEGIKKLRPKSGRPYVIIIIPLVVVALIIALMFLGKRNISIIDKAVHYFGTQSTVETKEHISAKGSVEKIDDITKTNTNKKDTVEQQDDMEWESLLLENEGVGAGMQEPTVKSKPVDNAMIPHEPIIPMERKEEKPLLPRFVLKAHVISRTWISICIDDKPAEEYLLQPGETPQWTANKGFTILVGNAGGIEFFLDGKEVGELGAEGEVVRIELPEE